MSYLKGNMHFVFILAAISVLRVEGKQFYPRKINVRINGGEFTSIEAVPYMASLIDVGYDSDRRNEPICGASIISKEWLVTAAHCLKDMRTSDLEIRTGASERYESGERHKIEQLIIHPDFKTNTFTMSNDIGLIKLSKPLIYNTKQTFIPLAQSSDEPIKKNVLRITGFGQEKAYTQEKVMHLKTAVLPIADYTKCQDDYMFDHISDKMICAGNKDSSCKGDSGGPAVMDGKLAGVVSSGYLCDARAMPAVFTAVNKYLDWIKQYVTLE